MEVPKKVVVVSTSAMARATIRKALEAAGYQAGSCGQLDSAEVLSMEPALVVLECIILGDAELAFMRAIKPTPLVLVVRRGDFNDARNALVRSGGGAYDALQSSPHPPDEIVEMVRVTFMRLDQEAART